MIRLAGYELSHVLGRGGMGSVWSAVAADGTPVALKLARPEILRSARSRRMLDAEIRATARLDHPHVLWVYDKGTVPEDHPELPADAPWLVLERCSGGTLLEHPPRHWEGVREVLVALLGALGHAHAHGLVHRDLKPANVLFSTAADVRPGVKLADFGIAHVIGAEERGVHGTPRYMAPEQAEGRGHRLGPWTDLYALGVVAKELVRPEEDASLPVPDGLDDWLEALTRADPDLRPRSAAAALRALARIDPVVEAPAGGWEALPHAGPRLRLQGAGLGLLALREPELVGRRAERARLWAALERARAAGRTEVVVVRGAEGLGRTRLLDALRARLVEVGEAEVRLLVLDDADREEEPLRLARALLSQRELTPEPTLVVLAVDAAAPRIVGLEGQPHVETLELGPLPDADLEELVRQLVGLDPRVRAALLVDAGGHPGWVMARIAAWVASGVLVPGRHGFRLARDPEPSDAGGSALALERALREVPESGIRDLERAATLGPEVDEEAWEDACLLDPRGTPGFDPRRVRARVDALQRLLDQGLARETDRGFAFRHPALADALLARAHAAGRLEEHHLAVASALAERPGERLAVGRHLAAAGRHEEALVPLMDGIEASWGRAGRRALAGVDALRRCLDRVRLGRLDRRRLRALRIDALVCLVQARMTEARELLRDALAVADELADPEEQALVLMRLCDLLALTHDEPLEPVLRRYLEVEHAVDRPEWSATVRSRLARHLRDLGELVASERVWDEALALLDDRPLLPREVGHLVELLGTRGGPAERRRLLEVVDANREAVARDGRLHDHLFLLTRATDAALELGLLDVARERAREAVTAAASLGLVRSWVIALGHLGRVELRAGDARAAGVALDQALRLVDEIDDRKLRVDVLLLRLQAATRLGDLAAVDQVFASLSAMDRLEPTWSGALDEALAGVAELDPIRAARLRLLVPTR